MRSTHGDSVSKGRKGRRSKMASLNTDQKPVTTYESIAMETMTVMTTTTTTVMRVMTTTTTKSLLDVPGNRLRIGCIQLCYA